MPNPDPNFWLAPGVIEHEHDNRTWSPLEKLLAVVILFSAIYVGAIFWIMLMDLGGWKVLAGVLAACGFLAWFWNKLKN